MSCPDLSGGTAPLVICSDCYDNANIYSRTRDYCHYSYLSEEDALDAQLPGDTNGEGQHDDAALHDLITRDTQETQHHALHHYSSNGQITHTHTHLNSLSYFSQKGFKYFQR